MADIGPMVKKATKVMQTECQTMIKTNVACSDDDEYYFIKF